MAPAAADGRDQCPQRFGSSCQHCRPERLLPSLEVGMLFPECRADDALYLVVLLDEDFNFFLPSSSWTTALLIFSPRETNSCTRPWKRRKVPICLR